METAKFCGNCGNPFPRSSETTSSLLKCEQGHIYSAVYNTCPYCPAAEANFKTRIEDAPATSETPALGDFATRIEAPAYVAGEMVTRIETPVPSEFMTRIEEPPPMPEPAGQRTAAPAPMPGTELLDSTLESVPARGIVASGEPAPAVFSVPVPPPAPQAPPPAPPPPPAGPSSAQGPESNRQTLVMSAEEVKRSLKGRGKLIGWLVSYTRNPDGEDFRLYAGYNRLGANPACDIIVEDETVSGSHAIIVQREGRCLIKDDLSRNGTFVNGKEITEAYPLQNYDQIRLGNTILTYVAAQQS